MAEVPVAKVIDPVRVDFAAEGMEYFENVAYGPDARNVLDIWYPRSDKPLPLIIWIHGGGWSDENLTLRYRPEPELAKVALAGFAVASIEYRLAQHAPYPAQVADCLCAVRYLRANAETYNLDPDKFGVWGESAGGHLASLVGCAWDVPQFQQGPWQEVSSRVQAVCPWYAPNDMVRSFYRDGGQRPLTNTLFGSGEGVKDKVWNYSPMQYVGRALPPYLNVHGDADKLVPLWQTTEFHEALVRHGNDSRLLIVPGQGHGFFDGQEVYDAVQAFFEEILK